MVRAQVLGRIGFALLAAIQAAPAQDRIIEYSLEGALSPSYGVDAEEAARRFLENRNLDRAVTYTLESRSSSFGGAVEHLTFAPRVAGVPFFGAAVRVHVDGQGRVVRFESPLLPAPPKDLAFHADARRAAEAAGAAWGVSSSKTLRVEASKTDAEGRAELRGEGFAGPLVASRTWFGLRGRARAAWSVYLEPEGGRPELTVVDAATEEILYRRSLAVEAEPDGYVFPAPETQNPGKGGQELRYLSGRKDGGPACPAPIYPGGLAGLCWTDGTATVGNNIDACADLDGNNVCDGRALGTGSRFLYPFTNAYETSLNPGADLSAALVNAFYWSNVAHDWLYELGFDEASGNFQLSNYGRGGYGSDAVRVDVQDGLVLNNAWFATPPDGIAPRMQLGLWPSSRRDAAFDGDVMLHEYVHGLTNRLVGGPLDAGALFMWQSGAMGEGWSDALAASFTDDPVIGEYVTRNASTGVRTVRYDQSPLTFGQFGTRRPATLPGTTTLAGLPAVHRDGEIWASALWDLRQALGRSDFERAVVAALKLTPRRPSMLDGRDAILQAVNLAGPAPGVICQAWSVFAARGMGVSASLNPVGPGEWPDTALSVFESFDAPASCGGSPPSEGATLLAEGAEAPSGWTASGLWRRTSRRAAAGGQSWWFGSEVTGNYDNGGRASGSLTSPAVDLTGVTGAVLTWRQYFRGEGFLRPIDLGGGLDPYLNLDSGRVWISTNGGTIWNVLTHVVHDTPGTGFVQFRVNLSRFVAQTIRLRFEFDTFTAASNGNEGWYIDDIQVRSLGAPPPELEVSPAFLTFAVVSGGAAGSQSLAIGNAGVGGLTWRIASELPAWLAASPASGAGPANVQISASAAALGPGDYATSLEIDAGEAGTIQVPVSLHVSAASPVAAWSFEETGAGPGVTVVDRTGAGHNGMTSGPGTAPAAGAAGRGRLFNGSSDAVIVAASVALTPERLTARIWVKLLSFPSSFGVPMGQFGGANAKGWYLAVRSTGELVLMGASPPSSMPWLVSAGRLELGRWHHVAATLDRTTGQARIYLDGTLDRTGTFPAVAADPSSPLTFGKASWTNSYFLNAVLDEAVLYPAIWSEAAVAQDFTGFTPPAATVNTAVAGQWNFDAGLADGSGNGHAATGAAATVPGVSGSARAFRSPADALQIPVDEQLNAASFTVRAWVKLAQAPTAFGDLISNYGADYAGWRVGITADGRPFFAVGAKPNRLPPILAPAALGPGRWTEITCVYDGRLRKMTLYVDGALAAERWNTDMTPRTESAMTFGRASWIDAYDVKADLDEVLIVPRAWSAAEVDGDFRTFAPPAPVTSHDPVALWSFEETATGSGTRLADATGNGHDIVMNGGRHRPHSGVSGAARWFGGWPDSAEVESGAAFAAGRFSFSSWVRLDQYPASWGVLFGNYDGAQAGWYAGVYRDGRVILCAAGPTSKPWLLSSHVLSLGHWHHVAVSFDGPSRRGRIYIDGEQAGSATFPSWAIPSGTSPTLGRAPWGPTGWLAFSMDEARFDVEERTPDAILTEYATRAGALNAAPVAEWRFEEAQGATALSDSTGRGHAASVDDPGAIATAGPAGGAWRFSGAGGATVQAHPELASSSFTFGAWIKLDALPMRWGALYSNYAADSRGWYVAVDPNGRVILCVAAQPGSAPWLVSAGSSAAGEWTHVAATFDGVSRRGAIYLDGALDRTAVFPGYTPQTELPSTIAKASWTSSYSLAVTIDRARLWTQERSAQQILELVPQ